MTVITFRRFTMTSPEKERVISLMDRSFPANERQPMSWLITDEEWGRLFLSIWDGDRFIGFISLLSWQDITHILYFAVEEELRGQGIGSEVLRLLPEYLPGQRLLADLERTTGRSPNEEQRRRRIAFYERHGFQPTGIAYTWRNEEYMIVSFGGPVTGEEFNAFWDHFEIAVHPIE